VLALVDRLCAVSPVVLVAEDLQWADEASLEVWRRLSGAVGQLPLLLVGSFRPQPALDELEKLRAIAGRARAVIELGPLSAGEVGELTGAVLGAGPGRRLGDLVGRAGGNPLYVRELLDALVRDGRIAVDGGVAELAGEPGEVPQSLAAAIADRLGVLPAELARVLRCAAVLGQECSVADLATVTGLPPDEVVSLAGQAATAGIFARAGEAPLPAAGISAGDGAMGFRHGLIRQAVYEGIPAPVRVALHRQAARALAASGESPERVAGQLIATPGTDDWECEWLAGAAPNLVYRAPEVAARLLRRSLAWLPASDRRREVLEAALVTAADLLPDREEVERVARPLLARTADPELAAQVSLLLSSALQQSGRPAEGVAVADQTLARPGLADVWTARLLSMKAMNLMVQGQFDPGEQVARQALAIAERTGDGLAVGDALFHLAYAALGRHDRAGMRAFEERG
jgi:hypothetical protein